jgi:23S rRNA (uracil1939-C5)-methyltransferase
MHDAERVLCPHADRCSGCPLIDRTYAEQLEYKRDRLARAIAAYPSLRDTGIDPPQAANPRTGYRTRAKLIVAPGPRIGLFAKGGGHIVVDIPECRVLSPALLETAARIRGLLASPPQTADGALIASGVGSTGALSAVDVREIDGDANSSVLVTLVIDLERKPSQAVLLAAANAIRTAAPRVVGVAASFRREDSPQVLGGLPIVISGPAATGATYGSFAQAHPAEAARVRDVVSRELAKRTGSLLHLRVLDLYGGSGATSLVLARSGARTTLVDSFAPAADGARAAARDQGLPEIDVRTGDAAHITHDLAKNGERFDAVVANPPRAGIAPAGRQGIADLHPETIAYISCDPDTLARDLDHFSRIGYRADRLHAFDLLPMTDHVETVAVLRPAPAPPLPVAYEDDSMLIVEKAAHEAVSGPGGCTLLDRAAKLAGGDAAVPVSSLPPGASGLVVLAKSPALADAVASAMRSKDSRSICLLCVRGITARTGTVRWRETRARYRRIGVAAGHSVVSIATRGHRIVDLFQGLARIGHHVLGDRRFGHALTNRHFEQKYGLCRPFFHCVRVEIALPQAGSRIAVESQLPGDLLAALGRMGADIASFCGPDAQWHHGHAMTAD